MFAYEFPLHFQVCNAMLGEYINLPRRVDGARFALENGE